MGSRARRRNQACEPRRRRQAGAGARDTRETGTRCAGEPAAGGREQDGTKRDGGTKVQDEDGHSKSPHPQARGEIDGWGVMPTIIARNLCRSPPETSSPACGGGRVGARFRVSGSGGARQRPVTLSNRIDG